MCVNNYSTINIYIMYLPCSLLLMNHSIISLQLQHVLSMMNFEVKQLFWEKHWGKHWGYFLNIYYQNHNIQNLLFPLHFIYDSTYFRSHWESEHLFSNFLITCRDSSVGRALDWRSKGPAFDPRSRQFCQNSAKFWPKACREKSNFFARHRRDSNSRSPVY